MAGKSAVVRVAIVGDNSSLRRALRDSQKGLRKFGGVARTLGGPGLALGMGVLAKQAIDVEAKFGKTMRTIAAVTNAPAKQIKSLNDLAVDLGQNTVFSANEAAGAMLELSKAGVPTKTILDSAAQSTLDLATAAGTDLGTAATIAANAMNAFGIPGKNLDKVTTAMVGGANASTASVESLQQGLSQVGSGAVNAGLDLNETVAALSAFDNAGVKGSDAGTSLKTMLQRLVPQTKKAKDGMKELGLDFTDSEGNFKSLADISEELKDGLSGLSEEERTSKLQDIFGSDATRAASILGREGKKGIDKYTKATKDAKAAARGAKAATEGTSGALERMSSTIETAQLKLGQELAPAVEKAADFLGEHLVPGMDKAIEYGKLFLGAIEPLVGPLKLAGEAIKVMAKWIDDLPGPVKDFAIQAGLAAIALPKVYDAMRKINGVSGTFITNMKDGAKRTTLLKDAAKQAAGVGGLLLLSDAFITTADEGLSFGSVLEGAAGGAGIGAMFGPIGTLIGAAGGAGLVALTGAFKDSKDAAEKTRLELLKAEGFQQATEDANTLADALIGVQNQYGKTVRAKVEASLADDEAVKTLRGVGVSMDTIVSASLGNAKAQRIVEKAYADAGASAEQNLSIAEAKWNDVRDGYTEYKNAQGGIESAKVLPEDMAKAKEEYQAAKDRVDDLTASEEGLNDIIGKQADVLVENRKNVRKLAKDLGFTVEEYRKLPDKVRTRLEGKGLPETIEGVQRLVKQYEGLQTFKNIEALVSAPGVKGTFGDVKRLAEQYELTPDQVKTLLKTEGVKLSESQAKTLNELYEDLDQPFVATLKVKDQASGPARDAKGAADDFAGIYTATLRTVREGSGFGPDLDLPRTPIPAPSRHHRNTVTPSSQPSQPSGNNAVSDRTLRPRRESNVNVYVGNEQVAAVVERRRVGTGRRAP